MSTSVCINLLLKTSTPLILISSSASRASFHSTNHRFNLKPINPVRLSSTLGTVSGGVQVQPEVPRAPPTDVPAPPGDLPGIDNPPEFTPPPPVTPVPSPGPEFPQPPVPSPPKPEIPVPPPDALPRRQPPEVVPPVPPQIIPPAPPDVNPPPGIVIME